MPLRAALVYVPAHTAASHDVPPKMASPLWAVRRLSSASPPPLSSDTTALLSKLKMTILACETQIHYKRGNFDDLLTDLRSAAIVGPTATLADFFAWCERAAQSGEPAALWALGNCCLCGIGTARDASRAAELLTKAAALEEVHAMHALAMCYLYGLGVAKDAPRAVRLLHKAAARSHPASQSHLGVLYDLGADVDQDTERAIAFYEMAVAQGYSPAMYNLSMLLRRGDRSHHQRASELCQRSAELGHPKALYEASKSCESSKALKMLHDAARLGETSAQFDLGNLYVRKAELAATPTEHAAHLAHAVELFTQSARYGHDLALMQLASCYIYGDFVAQDVNRGLMVLAPLVDRRDNQALVIAGELLLQGDGVAKDERGLVLLQLAADSGYPAALCALGDAYAHGFGVPADRAKAVALYAHAAEACWPHAMWEIGRRRLEGLDGVEKDAAKGEAMLAKAAGLGGHDVKCRQSHALLKVYRSIARPYAERQETFRSLNAAGVWKTEQQG